MTDDWDNDDDWDDYPIETDETETVICANCRAEVYEDSPSCPKCGEYLVAARSHFSDGKPLWYVILAIAGIFATTLALLWI